MSLINAETGEIVADLQPDEARSLTEQIKTLLGASWEMVKQAYQRRAWAALGYDSWDHYCAAEFGSTRLKLPREERQEAVASLRDAGLSIRAIAATGIASKQTVERDLASVMNHDTSTEPPAENPGPSSPVDPAAEPEPDLPPAPADNDKEHDVDVMERLHQAAQDERKIIGKDGKQYPDRSRSAVEARVAKAKKMAAEGYTSRQIAAEIGITAATFVDFRQRHGVVVPADAVVGKTRNHDHDRIVNESVSTLEGVVMGLDLVNVGALDPDRIAGWATSLSNSLRSLNRFQKQLKEMTQ